MSTPTNSVPTHGSAALGSGANDVAVAILAEFAIPTLYQRNGFRILGLPSDATAREISRRKQTIEKAMTHSLPISPGSGPYFPLVAKPDQSAVREAMQRLSEPERRLVDDCSGSGRTAKEERETMKHSVACVKASSGRLRVYGCSKRLNKAKVRFPCIIWQFFIISKRWNGKCQNWAAIPIQARL